MLQTVKEIKPIRQHPPVRWPDKRKGPWSIALNWLEVDGRYECVGVEIWKGIEPWREYEAPGSLKLVETFRGVPGAKPEPVTASGVRKIPLATLVHEAWSDIVSLHSTAASLIGERGPSDAAASLRQIASRFAEPDKGGRGRPKLHRPEHFDEVASVYVEAWNKGDPPTRAVAAHFGVSHSTAARWVARARKEFGLLGPTKPGKASGVVRPAPKRRRKG